MRQAGVAKMGYIRTPDSQTELILKYLTLGKEDGMYRLLDPCCGEGIALRDTKNRLLSQKTDTQQILSYGIELDQARAAEAKEILDQVSPSAYEQARTTKAAYSLLWLNPPYDHTAAEEDIQTARKELTFLRGTVEYLATNGLLIYIIPQHRLSEQVATTLAWRFEDFSVYRFEDGEYEIYSQIVVFAKRKLKSGIKTDAEKAAFKHLRGVGRSEVEIPILGEQAGELTYTLPTSSVEDKVFQFRGHLLDPKELAFDLERSNVWKNIAPMVSLTNQKVSGGQPLLPLKVAHLGTIISAGAIDGVIGTGEDRHMLVGLTRKMVDKTSDVDDNGNQKNIETERWQSAVKVYTPSGLIKELK